jgi:hypothetical protein
MFLPSIQKALDVFDIDLILLKYQQFLINKLFGNFIGACNHLKDIQTIISINVVNKTTLA